METLGAFFGDGLRRHTPRAALLSALAGVAITFIAMGFVFQIFATPLIALLPMVLILVNYASGIKLPLGLPGGLAAVLIGTGFAWGLRLCAACLGSAFPTTIYIGHPGWKAMGARTGYSVINGVAITGLCLVGGMTLVLRWVPLEATLGILLWIGLIITAQAFQETPKQHALAVAVGFIPALAAWALLLIDTTLRKAGASLFTIAPQFGADLFIYGVIALSQGFILTSMILAAILAFITDRNFLMAGVWALAAAGLSAVGLIHAYVLTPMAEIFRRQII